MIKLSAQFIILFVGGLAILMGIVGLVYWMK